MSCEELYEIILDNLEWFLDNMTDYDYPGAQTDYNRIYDMVHENTFFELDEMYTLFDSLISHYKTKNPDINDFIDAVDTWKDKVESDHELYEDYIAESFPINAVSSYPKESAE